MSPSFGVELIRLCLRRRSLAAAATFLALVLSPALALAQPCHVPDNGTGTVTLPPAGCGYLSPTDVHMIIAGLPPGTTIDVGIEHSEFFNIVTTPGCGSLGGDCESFNSTLKLVMQGTGGLTYNRTLTLQVATQTHTGPRTPGATTQSFDTDMLQAQGQLPPGDPDFDLLRITAGTGFGMPSPGHTTLTQLPGGNWNVDSFFDITYRIDFIGRPGGPLSGMSGSTTGTIRMASGIPYTPPPPCSVPDNGSGTVSLPPIGCGYVSPADLHMIINGLPPGTTIQVGAEHDRFFNVMTSPGGPLGGEIEQFLSNLTLKLNGTGALAGFSRMVSMPMSCETHVGPRTPSDPVQSFDTDMFRLLGQLPPGDPDFDLLRITAGTGFGMPSPGHTTLTRKSGGNWNVDSFFDITYRIDFVGAPGGPLSGMSGSTTGTIRMNSGVMATTPPPCTVADNGTGTVSLPPAGCDYVSPAELHMMIDGLPPGTTIEVDSKHNRFFNVTTAPGGTLGGEVEQFLSSMNLNMMGTGGLASFSRMIVLQAQVETHVGPRTPGDPVQSFDTDMYRMQGQLPPGDPDFDLLRITAGTGFGLPSPGHTTLTRLPGGNWNVDSFFDITYRIDFVGRPGGPLSGMSGSTTGTIRMGTGGPPAGCAPIAAGTDSFPSTAKMVVQQLDPTGAPVGEPFMVRASSADHPAAMVQRQPQVGGMIQTELLSLDLRGSHPMLGGEFFIRESALMTSPGSVQNVVQDPGSCGLQSGDSFFDVFTDLSVPALGETWTNNDPLRIHAKLNGLPPRRTMFENPFVRPIVLYDQASGLPRAQILYGEDEVDPDFPPPGRDCLPTDIQIDVDTPGGPTTIFAAGPTTVDRRPPTNHGFCSLSGGGCTTDTDCPMAGDVCLVQGVCVPGGALCYSSADCAIGSTCMPWPQIDTEIVAMNLTGNSPLLGPVQVRESPSMASTGTARSQNPPPTYRADSFFDVFVEVDLPAFGTKLHNQDPVPLQAWDANQPGITNVPPTPGTQYLSPPGTAVTLYDPSGAPSGRITRVDHRVRPPVSCDPPPPPDEYCFDSWIVLNIRIYATGCTETIMLPGNFRILRGRSSDPGDGRDLMRTLMARIVADGSSQCLGGTIRLRPSPSTPSLGQVQSLTAPENAPYDSFFDVFTELSVDGTPGSFSIGPAHMTTTINNLPPDDGEIYYGPGTVLPLRDAAGNVIGEIEEVKHEVHQRIVPCPCETDILIDAAGTGTFQAMGAGAGLSYNWARMRHVLGGPFVIDGGVCDSGPTYMDALTPMPNQIVFMLAADGFDGFVGTYGNCVQGPIDWDVLLAPLCGP